MAVHRHQLRRLTRNLVMVMAVRQALQWITVWFFVWGAVVLALRFMADLPSSPLAWGLLGGFPLAGVALWSEWRRRPEPATVKSVLDRENQCGGLLMTDESPHAREWLRDLAPLSVPRIAWKSRSSFIFLTAATLFLMTTLLIPDRFAPGRHQQPLHIGHLVEELETQFEVLEEEELVEAEEFEDIQEALQQLRQDSSGRDPARTWESLDYLKESASQTARESAEETLAKLLALTQAETLAAAMAELPAGALDEVTANQALADLATLLQNAKIEEGVLAKKIPPDLLETLLSSPNNTAELRELLSALKQCKGNLGECMSQLAKCKLIDAIALGKCQNAGKMVDPEGLIAFLCNFDPDSASLCQAVMSYCRGGITRGRGDAPMTWTTGTNTEGADFKEETLPPGAWSKLDDTQLIGASRSAPELSGDDIPVSVGALNTASAGGGMAHAQAVLPRHQAAVQRFFKRSK